MLWIAALVDVNEEEFGGTSTIIDGVYPTSKGVRTLFFDAFTDAAKINNGCPSRFEGVGEWDVTGAPRCYASGVDRV